MAPMRAVAAILASLAISGCSFPQAGPTVYQVEKTADPKLDVYLVKLTPPAIRVLAQYQAAGFPQSFRIENGSPSLVIRPGDVIAVSIYETGNSPLFGGARGGGAGSTQTVTDSGQAGASQAVTLPQQTVELDGTILVPFVGKVPVRGKSPSQAADEITRRLASQTANAQVIVSLVSNNTNAAIVGGEVNKAGLVPLSLRGERLLDVVSQAGGPKYPAFETDVRVIRGQIVASIPLQQILSNPADNIVVRPNDNVILVRNPKTFVVMGAAAKVSQYSMDAERVTLAEGIARAGGTVDTVGSLSGIYLFRSEPTSVARQIVTVNSAAVDASYVDTPETRSLTGPTVRMIYRIDLTQAEGYFFAQNVTLRDKDIVLVANADSTQIQKVLTLLRGFTGLYFDVGRSGTYIP